MDWLRQHCDSGHIRNWFEKFTVPKAKERVSERASERVSAAKHVSGASSAEQTNEGVKRVNERADERMAQYLCPDHQLI